MKDKIIAIFGGSFNPPINSHLNLARQVLSKLNNIEKIIFVPVSNKYKKEGLIEDKHRLKMLNLLCKDEEQLDVSSIEMDAKRQLFTIETLNYFKEKYKDRSIYFIMGTDNLKELNTWKTPEEILKNYKLIVLERQTDDIDEIIQNSTLLKKYKKSIIKLEGIDRINLSSTVIRIKIKNGENVEEYINKDVLKYIKENKLYN